MKPCNCDVEGCPECLARIEADGERLRDLAIGRTEPNRYLRFARLTHFKAEGFNLIEPVECPYCGLEGLLKCGRPPEPIEIRLGCTRCLEAFSYRLPAALI